MVRFAMPTCCILKKDPNKGSEKRSGEDPQIRSYTAIPAMAAFDACAAVRACVAKFLDKAPLPLPSFRDGTSTGQEQLIMEY